MNKEIKPTYVTFEQAELLAKKGFNERCKYLYRKIDKDFSATKIGMDGYPNNFLGYYAAPEQWQVVEWLLQKHQIWITVTSISQESWQYHISKPGDSLGKLYEEDFYNPQEAYSAAFDYILKELI